MKKSLSRFFSSRYFQVGVGLAVSGLSLYLALRNVNLQDVWIAILQADLWYVGLALVSVMLNNLAKAVRWKVLMGAKGQQVHLAKAFVSHLAGQTLNVLFPARVGDLSRAHVVGGMGPGRVFVLGTVMVEKVPDMIAYAFLFLLLMLLIPLPGWLGNSGVSFAIITLVVAIVVFFIAFQRDWLHRILDRRVAWLPENAQSYIADRLRSALSSLDTLKSRRDLFWVTVWTAVIWAAAVWTNHLVLLAFGIYLPLTASVLTLIALQAGITIPSVPGRIGIFEYICVLTLGVFGVGKADALSYGILLHAIVFLPMVILGLPIVFLLGEKANQSDG